MLSLNIDEKEMKKLLIIILLAGLFGCASMPSDKRKHLIAGVGIGLTVTWGTKKPVYGFGAGCAAGALKEAYDSRGNGTVEFADLAYTCLGAGGASWLTGKIMGK